MNHYVIVHYQHKDSEMEFTGWYAVDKDTALAEFTEENPDIYAAMAYAPATK